RPPPRLALGSGLSVRCDAAYRRCEQFPETRRVNVRRDRGVGRCPVTHQEVGDRHAPGESTVHLDDYVSVSAAHQVRLDDPGHGAWVVDVWRLGPELLELPVS